MIPHRLARVLLLTILVASIGFVRPRQVGAADDVAARGLDAFVLTPETVAEGNPIEVRGLAFGYATVTRMAPAEGVKVEVAIRGHEAEARETKSSADGTFHVSIVMPKGEGPEELIVRLSHDKHMRERTFAIQRVPRAELEARVLSTEIVPGSALPVWVTLKDARTRATLANQRVRMRLTEGGVTRRETIYRTDLSGAILTNVTLPEFEGFAITWQLQIEALDLPAESPIFNLSPRGEPIASPKLTVMGDKPSVRAGERANFTVEVADASGEPLEGVKLSYVVSEGQPDPERWTNAPTLITGADGTARGGFDVPALSQRGQRHVFVRGEAAGRELDARAFVAIHAKATPSFSVVLENRDLIPGVSQRAILRGTDAWGEPLVGIELAVKGDGLDARVTTDSRGAAEMIWNAPLEIGATHAVGPCGGGVRATVAISFVGGKIPEELKGRSASTICAAVDRSRSVLLRPATRFVRAGAALDVGLFSSKALPELFFSQLNDSAGNYASAVANVVNGQVKVSVPEAVKGPFDLTFVSPRVDAARVTASSRVLVLPRDLPKVTARIAGGRSVPGGEVEVEALLRDEAGKPLTGRVSAVVFDTRMPMESDIVTDLDTRLDLCRTVNVDASDCDRVLSGEAIADAAVVSALEVGSSPAEPRHDPQATAATELRETFGLVLRNLEGAVFEASRETQTLEDALRAKPRKNEFNPELFHLVTNVMKTPPLTPGGEPFELRDLVAVDPQVTYDHVARRVTRLKMLRVLTQVRRFRHQNDLDLDEPILADPNGMLRRASRESATSKGMDSEDPNADDDLDGLLLDPWGTSMQFVKAGGSGLPFVRAVPGWELRSAGPDKRFNTGDDVKDPFERVVASGTPYARAMGEDKIVDSRLDMRVGDASVEAWSNLFESFTGSRVTEGGQGFGNGNGRLGGRHRTKSPSVRMGATKVSGRFGQVEVLPPVRTDATGRALVRVALGVDETTYRIVLVATPDRGSDTAAASVDVPASLPLSVRIAAGNSWVEGDETWTRVVVRNRTDAATTGKLKVTTDANTELCKKESGTRDLRIPSRGLRTVEVCVVAKRAGTARLHAVLDGARGAADNITHEVEIRRPGTSVVLGRSRAMDESLDLDLFTSSDKVAVEGAAKLVFDADADESVARAIRSMSVDRLSSSSVVLDALFATARVRTVAVGQERRSLADLAARADAQAMGRFLGLFDTTLAEPDLFALRAQGSPNLTQGIAENVRNLGTCPNESSQHALIRLVESEPVANSGATACWESLAARAIRDSSEDVFMLSRVVLAWSQRAHRKEMLKEAAAALARLVSLRPTGGITLSDGVSNPRAARSVVYAALFAATNHGAPSLVAKETLQSWLLVQQAPNGSFGSTLATRAAIEALVESPRTSGAKRELRLEERDVGGALVATHRIGLEGASKTVTLGPRTRSISLTRESGVGRTMIRLEQPALRHDRRVLSPSDTESALGVVVRFPDALRVKETGLVSVHLTHRGTMTGLDPAMHIVRVPLPPGARLADQVPAVRQVPGALLVSMSAQALPIFIPVYFGLGGRFSTSEPTVKEADDSSSGEGFGVVSTVVVKGAPAR